MFRGCVLVVYYTTQPHCVCVVVVQQMLTINAVNLREVWRHDLLGENQNIGVTPACMSVYSAP